MQGPLPEVGRSPVVDGDYDGRHLWVSPLDDHAGVQAIDGGQLHVCEGDIVAPPPDLRYASSSSWAMVAL